MKATRVILSFAAFSLLVAPVHGQQQQGPSTSITAVPAISISERPAPGNLLSARREYTLGPGDAVELKVLGEPQMDGVYEVDGDGNLSLPFIEQPVVAQCRTVKALRKEVMTELAEFLRTPQVYMRVREKGSRPAAVVYGAVRSPAKFEMHRPAKLLELLSSSGGVTEQHNGTIQITHTLPQFCPDEEPQVATEAAATDSSATDELGIPYTIYKVSDLKAGKAEANPVIRPGDIVYVAEASPVYIIGAVNAPQGFYLRDQTTLSTAMAMVGGIRRDANSSKVRIYRQRPNSTVRDEIVADYKSIKKNKKDDIILQPYDVIEVGESHQFSKGRLFETLTGFITGGVQSIASVAPTRVLY